MSKQRIIDYVMNTPGDTNPNVLNSLLDEEMNDLPPIGPEDKNKYLHTNESTGDLEWAEGGVLVVTATVSGDDSTLSATYKQIVDAGFCVLDEEVNGGFNSLSPLGRYGYVEGLGYGVVFRDKTYLAETENDYPVYHDGK